MGHHIERVLILAHDGDTAEKVSNALRSFCRQPPTITTQPLSPVTHESLRSWGAQLIVVIDDPMAAVPWCPVAIPVLESLRSADLLTPIVFISHQESADAQAQALLAGASDCLFDSEVSPSTLECAIQRSFARREVDVKLRERLVFDKLITKLSMQFIHRTPDEVRGEVTSALSVIGRHIQASRSFIFLHNDDGSATQEYEWCAEGVPALKDHREPISLLSLKWVTDTLSSMGAILVSDSSPLPPEAVALSTIIQESGVKGLALFPLESRGTLIGSVGFSTLSARALWSPETVRLLKITANILGAALQQRKVQRALHLSELRYRTVVQGLGEGILLCDPSDRILQVNDRMGEITGYSSAELIGQVADEFLLPPGDAHLLREHTAKRLQGENERYEIRLKRKDGSQFWAQINATPVYEDGKIIATLGAVTDVSAQKESSEALRASEEKYRDLVETSSDLIWSVDLSGRITFVNSACRAVYRCEPQELIGKLFTDLVDPTCREKDMELFRAVLGGKEVIQAETKHLRPDGSTISLSINAIPLRGPEQEIVGATGTASDITRRREVEDELRAQEEFLRQVVDLAPNLILVKDSNFRFTLVNQAFASQYGLTPAEIVGKTDADIHPNKKEAATFVEECKYVLSSLQSCETLECPITDPQTGEIRWHYTIRKPLVLPDGRPPQVLTVATDITLRRKAEMEALRLEKQLLQAQKMEAIGQLAAGVAHDLNNALGAVVGHLQLLQLSRDLSPSIANSLEIALGGCERALSLIEQLLGFSRQGKYNLQTHSLRKLVDDTVSFLSKVIEKDIEIRFEGDGRDYMVQVDAGQLQQALTNLIINAKQAMPKGGTITFSFEKRNIPDPSAFNAKAVDKQYVLLSVSDSGSGIDPLIAHKIFEPFFTTKQAPRGGGTGLGLAMVYGILQSHGGWVDIDSSYEEGACFRMFLPLRSNEGTNMNQSSGDRNAPISPSSGTVLVVDDEPILVDLTRRFLEIAGIASVGFTSPEEAVVWYRDNHSTIDLVVLDMKMAKMDGPACFAALREINPKARVAILSGYVQDEAAQQLLSNGALRFFQKPLKYPELVRWITVELSEPSS